MNQKEKDQLYRDCIANLAPKIIDISNDNPFIQESRLQDVAESLASIAIAVVNAAELYESEISEKEVVS